MSTHPNGVRNGESHKRNETSEVGTRPTDSRSEQYERVIGPEIEMFDWSYRLLVPVLSENSVEDIERLMQTAATIAHDRDGLVLVLSLVALPEQTPLDLLTDEDPPVREAHENVERLLQAAVDVGVPAEGIICHTHREARSILSMAEKYECDGVLLTVRPDRSQRRRLLSGSAIEKVVARAEADVFVEKLGPASLSVRRVLLAAAGGPHSGLAAETARALALTTGACVDVVHSLDDDPTVDARREAERILQAATHVLDDVENVETELVNAEDVAEALIHRSNGYDVTVLGAPTKGLLLQFVLGTVPDSVKGRSKNAVLMTKQNTGKTSVYDRWIVGDETE